MTPFGFFGKYALRHEVVSQGWGVPGLSTRMFSNCHLAIRANVPVLITYDAANTGTAPDSQRLLSAAPVAYNPADVRATIQDAPASRGGSGQPVKTLMLTAADGNYRGLTYNNAAPLTPTTRKVVYTFIRPELLTSFHLGSSSGTGTGNHAEGALALPYLIGAKTIYIFNQVSTAQYGTAITSIVGAWPVMLENLHFTAGPTKLSSIQSRFPANLKNLILGNNQSTFAAAANINALIANCVNLEALLFNDEIWSDAVIAGNATTSVVGALTLPATGVLKYFALVNSAGQTTDISYTPGQFSGMRRIQLIGATGMNATTWRAIFDEALASTVLETFNFKLGSKAHSRSITNSDIGANLTQFIIYNNQFTGSISVTTAKPNLVTFQTGDQDQALSTVSKNDFATVDVSGLTHAQVIDLSNSQIVNLTLPVNTVVTQLLIGGNKLDTTVNTALLAQVNAMSALQILRFHAGSSVTNTTTSGQDSINGLGVVDVSPLANLSTLWVTQCKVTGTLTLPGSLTGLIARSNTGLLGISGAGNALVSLVASGCTLFDHSFTVTPNVTSINVTQTGVTTIDVSGKTNTNPYTGFIANSCPSLTHVKFGTTAGRYVIGSGATLILDGCPLLSLLENIEYVSWANLAAGQRIFNVQNCALNQDLKIGVNNWLPAATQAQNNGMSQANVDLNIGNIYTNRAKWVGTAGLRSLNIGGTNAAPTGTYQAPAGFVLGVSDGTPASAKEQAYVLVNNYAWTITMN